MKHRESLRNLYFQKAIDDKEIEINGGTIIYINARGKIKQNYGASDPEEYVRALVYVELLYRYKYKPKDITIEETIPKVSSEFADIVVRYPDSHLVYAVIETKKENANKPELNKAINDQYVYALNLDAEFYIVDCNEFSKRKVFSMYKIKDKAKREKWGPKEREKNKVADLTIAYGKVNKYKYIKASEENDLEPISDAELLKKFKRCHQILWDQGAKDPAEAFDEMSKFIFVKTDDELTTNDDEAYTFQIGNIEIEDKAAVAKKIRSKYTELSKSKPGVFTGKITADDSKIYKIVELLQGVDLKHSDIDSKGRAFEQFLDTVFKQKLGQYFTDRRIVMLIVNMMMALYPSGKIEKLRIIDPSCGSAGFLLNSLVYVRQHIHNKVREENDRYIREKEFNRNIFGIEKNEKIARVAMMDMIIFNDGHTNIECGDGLSDWSSYKVDGIRNGKGKFDIVLSNPPFGSKADDDENDQPYVAEYNLGGKFVKDRTSQSSDVLFIERNIDLLKPNHDGKDTSEPGHMAIVIPDGILNNSSFWYVRKYIEERCHVLGVISLPNYAFKKTGSGSKTSILILKKFTNIEIDKWKQDIQKIYPVKRYERNEKINKFIKDLDIFIESNDINIKLTEILNLVLPVYKDINQRINIIEEKKEIISINNDKEIIKEFKIESEDELDYSQEIKTIIELFGLINRDDKISCFENNDEQKFALLFKELESLVNLINRNTKQEKSILNLKVSKYKGKTKKVYTLEESLEKDFAKDKTILNILKNLGFDILKQYRAEIRELEILKETIDSFNVDLEAHKYVYSSRNEAIFMANTDKIGYDASGRNTENELYSIKTNSKIADLEDESTLLGQWNKFLKDKINYKGV